MPGDLDAVHARHEIIQQDQVERRSQFMGVFYRLQAVGPAFRFGDSQPPFKKQLFQYQSVRGIIVHYKGVEVF